MAIVALKRVIIGQPRVIVLHTSPPRKSRAERSHALKSRRNLARLAFISAVLAIAALCTTRKPFSPPHVTMIISKRQIGLCNTCRWSHIMNPSFHHAALNPAIMARFALAAILALSFMSHPASAQKQVRLTDWATIQNKRFGFQIAYPSNILFPAATPTGEDGRILKSADGKAKLLVATFDNAENLSIDAYRQFLLSDIYANTSIVYAPTKNRWFVLSGTRGDETFYERVTFSCGGKLINSWAMLYPTAERALYDRVVEAVAKTYTPGSGADGNCGPDRRAETSDDANKPGPDGSTAPTGRQ